MFTKADLILAGSEAQQGVDTFWSTGIGPTIKGLLVIVGVLVVIFALFKGIPKFISGKFGDGFKALIGGLLVAAVCFRPELLTGLVDLAGDMIGMGTENVENIDPGTGGTGEGPNGG